MLSKFPLRERVQHKFVRNAKIHVGETDLMNSLTSEKLCPEHILYCESKRKVLGHRTLLLTGIME